MPPGGSTQSAGVVCVEVRYFDPRHARPAALDRRWTRALLSGRMNKGRTKKLVALAYHEAGHAVAAYRLKFPITEVTIVAQDDYLGAVTHKGLQQRIYNALAYGSIRPQMRVKIEEQMIISIAGPVAEQKYRGRYNHIAARSDWDGVTELALALWPQPDVASTYIRWMYLRAVHLINDDWPAVEAVANALLAMNTLRRKDVVRVIKEDDARRWHAESKAATLATGTEGNDAGV